MTINLFRTPYVDVRVPSEEHLLHGSSVEELERDFAEYVGANYAVSVSSATMGIMLALNTVCSDEYVHVPSLIPSVVLNAIEHSGNWIKFTDNVDWIGKPYLLHTAGKTQITDSAHQVRRDQWINRDTFGRPYENPEDLMIFSFYPTKPLSGCDGGMIVSDDHDLIEHIRMLSMNGTTSERDSWKRSIVAPGWKAYMNTVQAKVVQKSLSFMDARLAIIKSVRDRYNELFKSDQDSDHLYRIEVRNAPQFILRMRDKGVNCGIHYPAMHREQIYRYGLDLSLGGYPKSEKSEETMVSIPLHYGMNVSQAEFVYESYLECK